MPGRPSAGGGGLPWCPPNGFPGVRGGALRLGSSSSRGRCSASGGASTPSMCLGRSSGERAWCRGECSLAHVAWVFKLVEDCISVKPAELGRGNTARCVLSRVGWRKLHGADLRAALAGGIGCFCPCQFMSHLQKAAIFFKADLQFWEFKGFL